MGVSCTLTAELLRETLSYDPDTGIFTRRISNRRWKAGTVAGHTDARGYVTISINGRPYWAHRLAWLYVHGEWPASQIDHISGVTGDNRIANLRDASANLNAANSKRPSHNTSGVKGVCWFKPISRWMAHITVDQKLHCLGYFKTKAEAAAVRRAAAERIFGNVRHE